ncbi:hypothetical protein TPA0909_55340 [Streptomyces albus]|nr:hypothetical protein TPA0909_55340 [Streptomyces albus]
MTPMFTPDSAPPFPVWAACAVLMCALAAAWLPPGRRDGARRARLLLAGGGAVTGRRGFEPPRWWRQFSAAVRARVTERFGRAWWCLPAALSLALLGRSWIPLAAGLWPCPSYAASCGAGRRCVRHAGGKPPQWSCARLSRASCGPADSQTEHYSPSTVR